MLGRPLAVCLLLVVAACRSPGRLVVVDSPIAPGSPVLSPSPPPERPLTQATVLDLDLAAGSGWSAALEPAVKSLLVVVVEQRGIDVRVSVGSATGGVELAAVDGPAGLGTDERLAAALEPGPHRLFLSPASGGPPQGRVRLRVETLREWQTSDSERVRLSALGQEATHLDASYSSAGWSRAHQLSLEELAGWRRLGDRRAIARTLDRLGSLERELGEHAQAIARGEEAVALGLALDDPGVEAASRYWLALSLYRADRVDEASQELASGLAAAERARDPRLQGRFLNWQGRIEYERGRLEAADALYARGLELRLAAHDLRGVSAMLNNRGNIALRLGRLAAALDYYQEAVAIARQLGLPGAELMSVTNMAQLLFDRGQWQEALDTFQESLDRATAGGDTRNEAHLRASLAPLLLKLGEPDAALAMLERSLAIERQRGDRFKQLSILTTLGWLLAERGGLESAEAALEEALEICREGSLHTKEASILRGLARLRLLEDRPSEALALLAAAAGTGVSAQPLERARIRRAEAEVLLALGRADEALDALGEAVAALGVLSAPEVRFEIAYERARAYRLRGDRDESLAAADLALGIVESLRSGMDDSDLRATFLSRVTSAYDLATALLLELDAETDGDAYARRAFETFERGKAKSLIELLNRARSGADAKAPPHLLEAERLALADVARLSQNLAAAIDRAGGMNEHVAALQEELADKGDRLRAAEQDIRDLAPDYAAIRYLARVTVADVQSRLPPDTAVVEYALRDELAVAFVITARSFAVARLSAATAIEPWVLALRATIQTPGRRPLGRFLQSSRALGGELLRPVLPLTEGAANLVIVPDGQLSYVPFEALRGAHDGYLVESHALAYAPSAAVFLNLASAAPARHDRGLVAFADPRAPAANPPWPRLPGARKEVEAVARVAAEEVTAFTDGQASEHRFKTEPAVGRARWLHLASHASVDEANPANTMIVLAADPLGMDDGYLRVAEVFALDLSAELVVLSGCETALGRQVRGEGLMGLTRAFLYAGAKSLQVSLWKVSDRTTAYLMPDFYRSLVAGAAPVDALRRAKLESLADPRRAHPAYWAPFVLIGGPGPTPGV